MKFRWLIACLALAASSCSGDDSGECFGDDECGFEQVCDRAAGTCVAPPGDCNGFCLKRSTCGMEDRDECIKSSCGASFLQYYGKTYGADCEQAWLNLMECNSNLTCDDLTTYNDQVDPETGTAPFCQSELQAKNSEC